MPIELTESQISISRSMYWASCRYSKPIEVDTNLAHQLRAVLKRLAYRMKRGCPISPRCSKAGRIATTFCNFDSSVHPSSRYMTAISQISIAGSYNWVVMSCSAQSAKSGKDWSMRPSWWVAKRRVGYKISERFCAGQRQTYQSTGSQGFG